MASGRAVNHGGLLSSPNRFPSYTSCSCSEPGQFCARQGRRFRGRAGESSGCSKYPPARLYYMLPPCHLLCHSSVSCSASPHQEVCHPSRLPMAHLFIKLPCATEYLTFIYLFFLPKQFDMRILIATNHWSCSKFLVSEAHTYWTTAETPLG